MITILMTAALVAAQPQDAAQQQAIADACLSPAEQSMGIDDFAPARRREVLGCLTEAVAKHINGTLPMQLDPYTTLTAVEAEGVNLIYRNRVEVDGANVTDADRANVSATVRGQVCGQGDMVAMIGLGATYTYVWTDRAGKQVHRLTISSCDA